MKLTHYAIRDLHAEAPDDEQPGVHDILAKAEDGRIFYSDDLYESKAEAEAALPLLKTYAFDYWEDCPLSASYHDAFCKHLTWEAA